MERQECPSPIKKATATPYLGGNWNYKTKAAVCASLVVLLLPWTILKVSFKYAEAKLIQLSMLCLVLCLVERRKHAMGDYTRTQTPVQTLFYYSLYSQLLYETVKEIFLPLISERKPFHPRCIIQIA